MNSPGEVAMRSGRYQEDSFEKPEYDIQHRRGSPSTGAVTAQPVKEVDGPIAARRFVEVDSSGEFDEYPDDRE